MTESTEFLAVLKTGRVKWIARNRKFKRVCPLETSDEWLLFKISSVTGYHWGLSIQLDLFIVYCVFRLLRCNRFWSQCMGLLQENSMQTYIGLLWSYNKESTCPKPVQEFGRTKGLSSATAVSSFIYFCTREIPRRFISMQTTHYQPFSHIWLVVLTFLKRHLPVLP